MSTRVPGRPFPGTVRRNLPWMALAIGIVLFVVVIVGLNRAGVDVGNVAEWAAAIGTVSAVIVALRLARSDRKHDAQREAAREAGMVIATVTPAATNPLTGSIAASLGRTVVRGEVRNYASTPMRNVYALLTWTHGEAQVDERGRRLNSQAVEYTAHHIGPFEAGSTPPWPPFEALAEAGSPPEVESFSVSWQDRWGTWWSTSAGGLPSPLELALKPLPIETFDPATRDVIDAVRRDQAQAAALSDETPENGWPPMKR